MHHSSREANLTLSGNWDPFSTSPSTVGIITKAPSLLIFHDSGVRENSNVPISSTRNAWSSSTANFHPIQDLTTIASVLLVQMGGTITNRTPPEKLMLRWIGKVMLEEEEEDHVA